MNLKEAISSFGTMDADKKALCDHIWDITNLEVQTHKLNQNNIPEDARDNILSQLKLRPALLVHIANIAIEAGLNISTFAEVGTAQGLQSMVFAKLFPKASVYTCDIRDVRDPELSKLKNLFFVAGNSLDLSEKLKGKEAVDFCWIDGSHDHYAVVNDFIALSRRAHKDTIWVFDDYDKRFGCFQDLNLLSMHFDEYFVADLGLTASGNPNKILVARGYE